MSEKDFYPFEPPDATGLSLIPLRVRYKLDCAGVRLRLSQWQTMTSEDKAQLLQLPVATLSEQNAYRVALSQMVGRQGETLLADGSDTAQQEWRNTGKWPEVVVRQCDAQQLNLPPLAEWQELAETDRHALFVLARSHHSQKEFFAAMALFFTSRTR